MDRQHVPPPPELADEVSEALKGLDTSDKEALWRKRWQNIMRSLQLSTAQQA